MKEIKPEELIKVFKDGEQPLHYTIPKDLSEEKIIDVKDLQAPNVPIK